MAAGMPAKLPNREEMVGGMAEGSEDAKQIARYIDRVRIEMEPAYSFFDRIVQLPRLVARLLQNHPARFRTYRKVTLTRPRSMPGDGFSATWPNLLAEPDSERMKSEETRFKSVVALVQCCRRCFDPANKASVVAWAADEINSRRDCSPRR